MPAEPVKFAVPKMYQILDENGKCNEAEMPKLTNDELRKIYENLVYARMLDGRILNLQREGRCGTYASSLGQEATQVGSAFALGKDDWLFPYFREIGAHITRGLPMHLYLLYWMGDERGSKVPEGLNDFVISIPVGTQNLHATGVAMAMRLKGDKKAAMVYLGDGATSEGDFHEAMNFAGVFKAPVIFVCQNNQWAISLPLSKQTASKTLAQKAVAYGFDGYLVDGNDVFAVLKVAREAAERAKAGGGPTFIECVTYRMSDHTTADDAGRYRTPQEVENWKKRDPIERVRKYMEVKGLWDEVYEKSVVEKANKMIEDDVREAEATPPAEPDDMFDYLYDKIPKNLADQKAEVLAFLKRGA
ncbi:MAG: pyruvate dehydrogenase (acetyl-transferring) E1 component subunit alpha [Candidatus Aenigmarchaeota archaeon]|nr:pyruvate dehydrogenase (acetyl-transferring) E1 component subunit alpha [Candidatus Aenigmarchaeota archaeon]